MVAIISVASWEHAVALARLWLVRGCVHLHHPAWQRWLTLGACARLVHLCPSARFSMARQGRGEESEWPQKGSAPLTLCHIVIRKSPRTRAQTKPPGSFTVLHLLFVVSLVYFVHSTHHRNKANIFNFSSPTQRDRAEMCVNEGFTWNRSVCCPSAGVSAAQHLFRDKLSSAALRSVAVMKESVAADLPDCGGEGHRPTTRITKTDGHSEVIGIWTTDLIWRKWEWRIQIHMNNNEFMCGKKAIKSLF